MLHALPADLLFLQAESLIKLKITGKPKLCPEN